MKGTGKPVMVAAVSGGPDSVYMLYRLLSENVVRIVVGHVNYGARGRESDKDEAFVERIAKVLGLERRILKEETGKSGRRVAIGANDAGEGIFPAGFEGKARTVRYEFLRRLAAETGAGKIALAHTADDQVETILMRVFEGAGVGGLKGIPRESRDGIVRPILDVWKEDILEYLKKHEIPYRTDRSNFDTRIERNWVRHVLIPLLEKRYGKSFKQRIFTLGERIREIDDYLDGEARKWIRRNVKPGQKDKRGGDRIVGKMPKKNIFPPCDGSGWITLKRATFSALPSILRVRILQNIGFDRFALTPNERLLKAMDRAIRDGGPSARVEVGKGWELVIRYEEAVFLRGDTRAERTKRVDKKVTKRGERGAAPGYAVEGGAQLVIEVKGKVTLTYAKRLAARGNAEVFDAAGLKLPLTVRPLRPGDRVRPFGLGSEKKVKEILIDRKIPREERWGRPVVCDAEGTILWIPGVVRSAHSPVTTRTRKTTLLNMAPVK